MASTPVLAAALAGVPIGIQRQGLWTGRRQIFIKFAGPAETATMYSADALSRELKRGLERSVIHSICIAGRDALANSDFLKATLKQLPPGGRVMADTDGQRPEAIPELHGLLTLVQVTLDPRMPEPALERAMETLKTSARLGLEHAVVVAGTDEASDADYLQIVELAQRASTKVSIVLHPGPTAERSPLDRRWNALMEHAMSRHSDVRLVIRLSGPETVR